eukprot:1573031-Heterocapsa_arctica.AAC.1
MLLAEGAKSGPELYYGDGSGGRHTADPRLRRCGWSVCHVDELGVLEPHHLKGGVFGSLGGHLQTVPRSEIWAAIVAIDSSS